MNRICCILFVLLSGIGTATQAQAQTITRTIGWTQNPEALTIPDSPAAVLAKAQNYVYTVTVDALPAVSVTQTCTLTGAALPVTCKGPIVMPNTSGPHTVTLTANNAFGSASGGTSGTSPGTPTTITITITIVPGADDDAEGDPYE